MIAKIVGKNVINNGAFDNEVPMYVYEEMVDGKKLTEIINKEHENVKYLPGHKLPENVVCTPFFVLLFFYKHIKRSRVILPVSSVVVHACLKYA